MEEIFEEVFQKVLDILAANDNRKVFYIKESDFIENRRCLLATDHRLIICLSGQRIYSSARSGEIEELFLNPGDVIFYQAGAWIAPHTIKKFESFGIVFLKDQFKFVYRNDSLKSDALLNPNLLFFSKVTANTLVKELIKNLENISASQKFSNIKRVKTIELLIAHACSSYLNVSDNEISKSELTYLNLVNFIEENFDSALDRERLAKAFKLHPNHVSRLFMKYSECSFSEYLINTRIEKAKTFLKEPLINASEAGVLCGFSSNSYFSKCFKKHTGLTPYQYKVKK